MCSDKDQIVFNALDPAKDYSGLQFKKKKTNTRKLDEAKKKQQALKEKILFFQ